MQRIPDFDGLRFVLCLGMAFFHYSFRVPVENEYLQHLILRFSYFTDVFFILSGLFLARGRDPVWSGRSYAAFVAKRLARIYPLHAAIFSCFGLLSILTATGFMHPHAQPDMDWRNALAQLFLVHSWGVAGKSFSYNYVSWSLSALLAMYLCFPGFDVLCRRYGGRAIFFVVAALIGCELLARAWDAPSITRAQYADIGILRVLPSFLFGMWLARQRPGDLPKPLIRFALAACVLVFLFHEPAYLGGEGATLEGLARLIFLYISTFVLYAASMQGIPTPLRWRGFVGPSRYSFGIFILHPLVGLVFFNMLPETWGKSVAGALLLISAGVLLSVLAAVVAWRLFENPVHRWLVGRIDAWAARRSDAKPELTSSASS
ncbi:acyltransferase [Brucella endophytica]|uniref:Acyltransferase n=1 Tax=Brucella endophytica TaxID=1963359 RepID=A0A916SAP3_9HYPH|nr:acyltransferase [Brucella endophytica]GGA91318.1 acyltransferase [Brucella endophytica]